MALAGKTTREVQVPHEPGNYFTFRDLSGHELDEAERENQRKAMLLMADIPRMEISAEQIAAARAGQPATKDPRESFDKDVLCKYGIVDWRGPNYEPDPCMFGYIEKLDAVTRDWAAAVILDLIIRTVPEELASARP
jgi:hypothetical protein